MSNQSNQTPGTAQGQNNLASLGQPTGFSSPGQSSPPSVPTAQLTAEQQQQLQGMFQQFIQQNVAPQAQPTVPQQSNPVPGNGLSGESDFEKIMKEMEEAEKKQQDMLKQQISQQVQTNYSQLYQQFQQERSQFQQQLAKMSEEYNKRIESMTSEFNKRFENVDKTMSKPLTTVPQMPNPYGQRTQDMPQQFQPKNQVGAASKDFGFFWNNPNLTPEQSREIFYNQVLKKN